MSSYSETPAEVILEKLNRTFYRPPKVILGSSGSISLLTKLSSSIFKFFQVLLAQTENQLTQSFLIKKTKSKRTWQLLLIFQNSNSKKRSVRDTIAVCWFVFRFLRCYYMVRFDVIFVSTTCWANQVLPTSWSILNLLLPNHRIKGMSLPVQLRLLTAFPIKFLPKFEILYFSPRCTWQAAMDATMEIADFSIENQSSRSFFVLTPRYHQCQSI